MATNIDTSNIAEGIIKENGKVQCIQPESISVPYTSHNIDPVVYVDELLSIPFAQHNNNKQNPYKKTVGQSVPVFSTAIIPQVNPGVVCVGSVPYSSHNIKKPPLYHNPQSTPYTQHFSYKPKVKSKGTSDPPSNFNCDNTKLINVPYCKCPPNISGGYAGHNYDKRIYQPILSTPYTQHFTQPINKKIGGVLPPPYVQYKRKTKNDRLKCLRCEVNISLPHLKEPKIISYGNIGAVFGSHNLNPLPKYVGGIASNAGGKYINNNKNKDKGKRKDKECNYSISAPFVQHVLDSVFIPPPTIGGTYGSHSNQKCVPSIRGSGGGINIEFVHSSDKSAIDKARPNIKCDKVAYNTTFASHSVYPNTKIEKPAPPEPEEYGNKDVVQGIPYGSHSRVKKKKPPYGLIENGSCQQPKWLLKRIERLPTKAYNDIPFGSINNGHSKCSYENIPFGAIYNVIGTRGKHYPVKAGYGNISNNPHIVY